MEEKKGALVEEDAGEEEKDEEETKGTVVEEEKGKEEPTELTVAADESTLADSGVADGGRNACSSAAPDMMLPKRVNVDQENTSG